MNVFATLRMLLPSRRHFKHAENDREEEMSRRKDAANAA